MEKIISGTQVQKETKESKIIILTGKDGKLTGKGLEAKKEKEAKKLLRKETNEAAKEFKQASKDERKKLSYHFGQLKKFGFKYMSKLSVEIGRKITGDEINELKYKHFLPFLTVREDYYNTVNGWSEERFINCVSRYYRNEAKKQLQDSVLLDIE
jgi:Ca2+-binding EF-hand superfamily protein